MPQTVERRGTMFDSFRLIILAFTGKFTDSEELRKAFWGFLICQLFAVLALAYNATMSYSAYRNLLDRAPGAEIIAGIVTTLAALAVLVVLNYVTFRIMFIWNGGKLDKKQTSNLVLFSIIVLGLIAWDIHMNLKGVQPISEATTEQVRENKSAQAKAQFDADISAIEAEIAAIKDKYKYPDGKIYFAPRPVTHFSKEVYEADREEVDDLQSQISLLRDMQAASFQTALSDYHADQERFGEEVAAKRVNHSLIVKLIYGLVFLIALAAANYSNLALDFLHENPLSSSGGKSVSRDEVQVPTTGLKTAIGFKQGQSPGDDKNPYDIQAMRARISQLETELKQRPIQDARTEETPKTVTVHVEKYLTKDGKPGYPITCQNCGKESVMASSRAKYCSTICRKEAWKKNNPGKDLRV